MDAATAERHRKLNEPIFKFGRIAAMTASTGWPNRRLLIVDDTAAIHEDFRKVLVAPSPSENTIGHLEAALFGAPHSRSPTSFDLDYAFQGLEALDKVQGALDKKSPYAMCFIEWIEGPV